MDIEGSAIKVCLPDQSHLLPNWLPFPVFATQTQNWQGHRDTEKVHTKTGWPGKLAGQL